MTSKDGTIKLGNLNDI